MPTLVAADRNVHLSVVFPTILIRAGAVKYPPLQSLDAWPNAVYTFSRCTQKTDVFECFAVFLTNVKWVNGCKVLCRTHIVFKGLFNIVALLHTFVSYQPALL